MTGRSKSSEAGKAGQGKVMDSQIHDMKIIYPENNWESGSPASPYVGIYPKEVIM